MKECWHGICPCVGGMERLGMGVTKHNGGHKENT